MPPAAAEEGAADGGDPADTETLPGHRDSTGRGDPVATAVAAARRRRRSSRGHRDSAGGGNLLAPPPSIVKPRLDPPSGHCTPDYLGALLSNGALLRSRLLPRGSGSEAAMDEEREVVEQCRLLEVQVRSSGVDQFLL